jgi:hypothetical protein
VIGAVTAPESCVSSRLISSKVGAEDILLL